MTQEGGETLACPVDRSREWDVRHSVLTDSWPSVSGSAVELSTPAPAALIQQGIAPRRHAANMHPKNPLSKNFWIYFPFLLTSSGNWIYIPTHRTAKRRRSKQIFRHGLERKTPMTLNLDCSFFMIVCDHKTGAFTPETNLCEMTFNQIVEDIQSSQIENVLNVIECNPAEGWSNDVTADVMAAAFPEPVTFEDLDQDPMENAIGALEAGCGRWAA